MDELSQQNQELNQRLNQQTAQMELFQSQIQNLNGLTSVLQNMVQNIKITSITLVLLPAYFG